MYITIKEYQGEQVVTMNDMCLALGLERQTVVNHVKSLPSILLKGVDLRKFQVKNGMKRNASCMRLYPISTFQAMLDREGKTVDDVTKKSDTHGPMSKRTLGEKMRYYRELRGFSQITVATKLGCVQSLYSKYEHDEIKHPSAEFIQEFAGICGIGIEKLQYKVPCKEVSTLPVNEKGTANNEAVTFKNTQFGQLRVVMKDGEPWFVAKDVCDALEIKNTVDAIKRLDNDERGRFNLGRQGEANIVNEYGLYSLILGSRKPEAKAFKRWVTHDVLPSINKTGSYSMSNTSITAGQAKTIIDNQRIIDDKLTALLLCEHYHIKADEKATRTSLRMLNSVGIL